MIIRYGKGRVGKVTKLGEMITFSKLGVLKMNSAEIDDTVLTVIFSQNAFYNEGGFSNGLELTNTTTTEVAGIVAMSGSGTGEATLVVSWITAPVLGDLLTLTYDGSDGIKAANDVDMEAQTIPCHNVLNEAPVNTSPPVISGTTYEGSILSCDVGVWDNAVSTYTYDWQRDGISTGGTSNTYLVELDDSGAGMTCVVTATNAIGSNEATSNTLVMDGGIFNPPNGVIGDAYSYTETAGFSAPYSIDGFLPNGFTINETTAEISGVALLENNFQFIAVVGNGEMSNFASILISQPAGSPVAVNDAYDVASGTPFTGNVLDND